MGLKVGINGFGRIGRNILRAALGNAEHRLRRGQRSDRRQDPRAPAQVRLGARQPRSAPSTATGDAIHVDGDEFKVLVGEGPGAAAVEGSRRRHRVRVHRPVHAIATPRPSTSRPAPRRSSSPRRPRGPDVTRRPRRQRRQVRPGEAPHHLERVVHDELPGAGRQGAARARSASRTRLDDDDPLLHQRPEAARPAAQGPAPRARGGAVDDPDHDRRGEGGRRGAARAEGQARRHRDARADAERLGRGPRRAADKKTDRRGGQRGVQEGGRRDR